jgi:hypothetical protein
MQLDITQYNTKLFSKNMKDKMLIAEASDLRLNCFERLYDDACDEGMALRNPKTGNVTRWYRAEERLDNEGDLQVTILKATSETTRRQPNTVGWEIHILND